MKHYVILSGIIGSIIGSVLTALLVSPVTAQRDKFDTIQCRRLEVVDSDDKVGVEIGTSSEAGGYVITNGSGGGTTVALGGTIETDYGRVFIFDNRIGLVAWLGANEHGGFVRVNGKDGKSANLNVTEHGGRVVVHGKGEGQAIIGINEYGNGAMSTWDKNGYRQ